MQQKCEKCRNKEIRAIVLSFHSMAIRVKYFAFGL
jgi:hypothetical protein